MIQPAVPAPVRDRPAIPTLTVVVPVFNESAAIDVFLQAVIPVLSDTKTDWTILFVNDGSRDDTLGVLLSAAMRTRRIMVLNLARNFGKEAAMTAGLDAADADLVAVMDVDLQDPPELITSFIEQWRAGYDVVYGVRGSRKDDTALKRSSAGMFYRVFNTVSPTKIPENAGDYRLMDRRVVDALKQLPERNRFMKGLFAWVGFPSIGVAFERAPRAAGETKFKFKGLWNFALDGLLSFSTMPLKAWTYLGGVVALAAIAYAAFIGINTVMFGVDVPGYASLMIVLLLATAMQLMSLGIIGEYIARLTLESKQRPVYVLEGTYDRASLMTETKTARDDKGVAA